MSRRGQVMLLAEPETTDEALSPEELIALSWRFTPHTYAEVMSEGRWKPFGWLRYVGDRIADTIARGNGRIIINAHPRSGKSEFLSHWVPTWYVDNLPHQRVVIASYADSIAADWGRMVRNEFERNPRCRTRLRQDSTSATRWHTPEGGGMVTAGVGSALSGRGGNLLLIDDAHKDWSEANNPLFQERAFQWYQGTLRTRAEPGATIVILMQRWAESDLVGMLLAESGERWEQIVLPAIAGENDLMGRAPGDPLCPERFGLEELAATRLEVGGVIWETCYQQNPRGVGIGRVYENFSDAAHVDETVTLRRELPLCLAFDFNIDPGMHAEIGQYDERADLFTCIDEIHGHRMNLNQCLEAFKDWLRAQGGFAWPELHVFGDASGHSESQQTSESAYDIVASRLRAMGVPFRVRVPRDAPPVRDSINAVNEALRDVDGKSHVKVHPRCKRLIADLKYLKLMPDGLINKRDKALSHAGDCFRYWLAYLRPVGFARGRSVGGRMSV